MVCYYHRQSVATGTCTMCGKALCDRCIKSLVPQGLCFDCALSAHAAAQHQITRRLVIASLLPVAVGLTALTLSGKPVGLLAAVWLVSQFFWGIQLARALMRRVRILATPWAWLILFLVCVQIAALVWPIQFLLEVRALLRGRRQASSVFRAAELVGTNQAQPA